MQVPSPAYGATPAAFASPGGAPGPGPIGPKLSLEQLACIQAELDLDPARGPRVFAANGVDAAELARQMGELMGSFAGDSGNAARFEQLREYYRAILGPRG